MNSKITNIALKGIALAMGVAVMVLSTLKTLDIFSGVSTCSLGLATGSGEVQGKWDRRDTRLMSGTIPGGRFRSWLDAQVMEHVWLLGRRLRRATS